MPPNDLVFTHSYFFQAAIARLIQNGMWFSDAVEVLQPLWPQSASELPADYWDPYYDFTRDSIGGTLIRRPTYKPIW